MTLAMPRRAAGFAAGFGPQANPAEPCPCLRLTTTNVAHSFCTPFSFDLERPYDAIHSLLPFNFFQKPPVLASVSVLVRRCWYTLKPPLQHQLASSPSLATASPCRWIDVPSDSRCRHPDNLICPAVCASNSFRGSYGHVRFSISASLAFENYAS